MIRLLGSAAAAGLAVAAGTDHKTRASMGLVPALERDARGAFAGPSFLAADDRVRWTLTRAMHRHAHRLEGLAGRAIDLDGAGML